MGDQVTAVPGRSQAHGLTWGEAVAARGFTPVPNLLLDHQAALGLSPREVVTIMQLEALRKRDGGAVVASREMLAHRLGMSAKGSTRS